MGEFIRQEVMHRLRAIGIPVREPLCRVRPLASVVRDFVELCLDIAHAGGVADFLAKQGVTQ
jgi:hypothetical protein